MTSTRTRRGDSTATCSTSSRRSGTRWCSQLPLSPLCRTTVPGSAPSAGRRLGRRRTRPPARCGASTRGGRPLQQRPARTATERAAPTDPCQRPRSAEVAVPKRKMSRSNTRSRRAQWKATAPHAGGLPAAAASPKLPHTACPTCGSTTGARSSLLGLSASCIGGTRAGRPDRGRGSDERRAPAPVTAVTPDEIPPSCRHALGVPLGAELLERALTHRSYRLRERRPADQRAAGVPRRLGARPRRHRHALPQPPGPARGAAGQAAGRGGQQRRAGRAWPATLGLGELRPARPRRGDAPAAATSPRSWPTRSRR